MTQDPRVEQFISSFQALRGLKEFFHRRVLATFHLEFRDFLAGHFDGGPELAGNELGDAVDLSEGNPHHASHVAYHEPREHRTERDDLGDAFFTVFVANVLDDSFAPFV